MLPLLLCLKEKWKNREEKEGGIRYKDELHPSQTATISNVSLSGRLHPHAAETYTQRLPHRGSLTEGVKKDRHQAVGQYITERRECERRFPANRAARGIRRGKDPPPASESGER